ncbi:MAG: PorT family protein [Chryseobacterium sp.]|uniref:outer membrane beta-barrel protein n=1 Tax=Chryseobacterium sp. TaxID=1871047 RepID=UPI00282DB4B0|nr:outer membrane beta-barrel protein [Chryseobacterium sp.]MDR2236982.1 PorT family protein [Chryseobacterium sp.]
MKQSLLTAFLLFSGILVHAQKFNFGIKGSVGRTTLETSFENPDFNFDSKGRLAIRIAGYAEYKLSEEFALQVEVAPTFLGGKYEYRNDDLGMINKISMHTLNFPLLFKYYPAGNFNLNTGVDLGFLIEAESAVSRNSDHKLFLAGDLVQNLFSEKTDFKDYIKSFSANPFVGAEYHLNNGLFLDTRYTFGVFNVAKKKGEEGFRTLKNSYLLIGVGYRIKKKK